MDWTFGLGEIDAEMMRMILIVSIPLVIINLVLVVASMVSLFKKKSSSQDKIIWVLVILLLDLIGPILYFAIGANMIDQKAAQIEDEEYQNR